MELCKPCVTLLLLQKECCCCDFWSVVIFVLSFVFVLFWDHVSLLWQSFCNKEDIILVFCLFCFVLPLNVLFCLKTTLPLFLDWANLVWLFYCYFQRKASVLFCFVLRSCKHLLFCFIWKRLFLYSGIVQTLSGDFYNKEGIWCVLVEKALPLLWDCANLGIMQTVLLQ